MIRQKKNLSKFTRIAAILLVLFAMTFYFGMKAEAEESPRVIPVNSVDEAAGYLKTALKEHRSSISFGFENALSKAQLQTMMPEIYKKACAYEKSDPLGGEYLELQVKKIILPNGYVTISNGLYEYRFDMTYYDTKQQEDEVEALTGKMLQNLSLTGKTGREKAKIIYNYIRNTVQYDSLGSTEDLRYTSYGALKNQKAVCSGYAGLLYRAYLMEGFETRIIKGKLSNGELHTWNIVRIDGNYYAVDVTLDAVHHTEVHFLDCDIKFADLKPNDQYVPSTVVGYPMGHSLKNKTIAPTVRTNGKVITYCEKCGHTISEKITYYPPKSTSIKKVTAGKKKCTVTLKRQTFLTSGYEIQYSRSSVFKGAKTIRVNGNKTIKKTIKGLSSRKKYYVRVRTFRKVGTQYCYSAWSARKKVKIR